MRISIVFGIEFEPSRTTSSRFLDLNGFTLNRPCLNFEFLKALLELLYGIPFGQQESLNNSTKSIMSIRPKENVKSELRRLKLEQQHIQRRVRPVLKDQFHFKVIIGKSRIRHKTTLDFERLLISLLT